MSSAETAPVTGRAPQAQTSGRHTVVPLRPAGAPRPLALTAAYYLTFIALGLTMASMGPTLPGLAEQTRTHLGEIGFLFTARSLGYLLGSLRGGSLYDRLRGHPLIAGAVLTMAAMMAAVPLVPNLWLLTAALLLLGIGEGLLDVGANTLLVWTHGSRVGPFMNGLHFFFGVGAFLSPIVIAQIALRSGGISWAYWALALAVLPGPLWLLRLPSPAAQAPERADRPAHADGLLLALLVLFFFLYVGAEASFGGWIYTYAVAMGLAGPTTAAYLTSSFWGSFTLGRLLGIPIAARYSPRTILLVDLAGALASVGAILAWPGSVPALWLGTCCAGLAMASIFPVTISFAERRMAFTGQVAAWFFVGSGAGGMTLPWLIGRLFQQVGPQVTILAILTNLLLAAATLAALNLRSGRCSGKP